jgi:uncharacterized membrane protein
MKKLYKPLLKFYTRSINSIAFLPTAIAVAFFLFSLLMLRLEDTPLSRQVQQKITVLLVQGPEEARLVLNAIITGILSLMVFSFSMVMIILSQASNNQSPRVIPGLITAKAYQVVLGFNIGTIIYALIMVLNVEETEAAKAVPEMGIFFGMNFAITCLALFVYHIHSVSQSIQVDHILVRVYGQATRHLTRQAREFARMGQGFPDPDTSGWTVLYSREEGYLTLTEKRGLVKFARKHDLLIEVLLESGRFTVVGFPLFRISRDIRQEHDLLDELYSYFIFSLSELNIGHYQYSMRQISEIAVKALSPGINDPGTATTAINFLTMIYLRKMACHTDRYFTDQDGNLRVIRKIYSLDSLLYKYLTPIRHYGKSDVMVTLQLLELFRNLMYHDRQEKKYTDVFRRHIQVIREEAHENISIDRDREKVERKVERLLQGELVE